MIYLRLAIVNVMGAYLVCNVMRVILDYVRYHNSGIRKGEFSELIALFAPEAELKFEGSSFGPFQGRAVIGNAFRSHPPDQELELYNIELDGAGGTVTYGWRGAPTEYGTFRVDVLDGLIEKVVVHCSCQVQPA